MVFVLKIKNRRHQRAHTHTHTHTHTRTHTHTQSYTQLHYCVPMWIQDYGTFPALHLVPVTRVWGRASWWGCIWALAFVWSFYTLLCWPPCSRVSGCWVYRRLQRCIENIANTLQITFKNKSCLVFFSQPERCSLYCHGGAKTTKNIHT